MAWNAMAWDGMGVRVGGQTLLSRASTKGRPEVQICRVPMLATDTSIGSGQGRERVWCAL